jgi:hypothetical protein
MRFSDFPIAEFHVLLNYECSGDIFFVISCYHSTESCVFCSYEATSSRKTRSLAQELATGAVASVFLVCTVLFILYFVLSLFGMILV